MKTTIRYTRQGIRVLVNLVIGVVILASLAFEKIVPAGDLHVGDIITYRPPSTQRPTVRHRQ